MENKPTPTPGSKEYNPEKLENLNTPQFNSSTEKRIGDELPVIENMNDQQERVEPEDANRTNLPESDIGNKRSESEDEEEQIIRR